MSGETIAYTYDSLKRLVSAAATTSSGVASWRQDYEFDGFGNLISKRQNLGTAVPIPVNAATNRLTNALYDTNGNMTSGNGATMTYDVANRMKSAQVVSGGTEYYSSSPDNRRIFRRAAGGGQWWTEEWTMYGAHGEKLGHFTMGCQPNNGYSCPYAPVLTPTISFAGRVIWDKGAEVRSDRLGTNRANGAKFYPYGEEISSTTNDRMKFGTYTRDGFTGLDYADQRFYASTYGRFNTADPYRASAGASDPGSWNRFAYVGGDPANYKDRSGLSRDQVEWDEVGTCSENPESCLPYIDTEGDGGGAGVPWDGRYSDYGRVNRSMVKAAVNKVLGSGTKCNSDITNQFGTGPGHGSVDALSAAVDGVTLYDTTIKVSAIQALGTPLEGLPVPFRDRPARWRDLSVITLRQFRILLIRHPVTIAAQVRSSSGLNTLRMASRFNRQT